MRKWIIHLFGGYTKRDVDSMGAGGEVEARTKGFRDGVNFIVGLVQQGANAGGSIEIEGVQYRIRKP